MELSNFNIVAEIWKIKRFWISSTVAEIRLDVESYEGPTCSHIKASLAIAVRPDV